MDIDLLASPARSRVGGRFAASATENLTGENTTRNLTVAPQDPPLVAFSKIAREATAFQVREVVDAMAKDSGITLDVLRADGGMVGNDLLMQFQSDVLAKPVVRPMVKETTALGAAYAAGLAVGFFQDTGELVANWAVDRRWEPQMDEESREQLYRFWKKAVTRAFDWAEPTSREMPL